MHLVGLIQFLATIVAMLFDQIVSFHLEVGKLESFPKLSQKISQNISKKIDFKFSMPCEFELCQPREGPWPSSQPLSKNKSNTALFTGKMVGWQGSWCGVGESPKSPHQFFSFVLRAFFSLTLIGPPEIPDHGSIGVMTWHFGTEKNMKNQPHGLRPPSRLVACFSFTPTKIVF